MCEDVFAREPRGTPDRRWGLSEESTLTLTSPCAVVVAVDGLASVGGKLGGRV